MKEYKLTDFFYQRVALFCLPLLLLTILRFAGFDGLYGQDAYEYLRYANAVQAYISGGEHPGTYFWPVLYPALGSVLGFLFGSSAFALQLISCVSFSVACIYVLKTLRLLYPTATFHFLYVLLFAVFSPFLLKMGLIVMSDALALVFVVLSVYFFFTSRQKHTRLISVFVFATCALMTRYASLFITLPLIVYALYLVWKRKAFVHFLAACLLSFIVAVPFILLQWGTWFDATSNAFLADWSVANYFSRSFTTGDGITTYTVPNLAHAMSVFFHPGFIFLGSILSIITLKNYTFCANFPQKMLLTCSSVYIFFLAGIPFQNPRIIGLVFPLILVFLFPAFEKMMQHTFFRKYMRLFGVVAILLQLFFFTWTFKLIYTRSITEKELTVMIKPYEGNTLYSFDVDLAMQGRGLDFDYKNMFLEQYKTLQTNDFILFDSERYETQWKDKNPMLNWEFMHANYILELVKTHPKGWKLYQVTGKK